MKIIFIFSIAILILLSISGCTPATQDSIIGTWEQTHTLGIPLSISNFYRFDSNGTYREATSQSGLSSDTPSSYSMSGNLLKFDTGSYDVYLLGTTMYWYKSNVEQLRFKKIN